jgi:hypothetical protein
VRRGRGGGQMLSQTFRKPWKFGQMLGKMNKIRADLSENILKLKFRLFYYNPS